MSQIKIKISDAKIVAMKEHTYNDDFSLNVHICAKTAIERCYYVISLYGDEAWRWAQEFEVGDSISVVGELSNQVITDGQNRIMYLFSASEEYDQDPPRSKKRKSKKKKAHG